MKNILTILIASFIASSVAFSSYSQEVVSNKESGLPRVVSVDELREYFLSKRAHYANGVRVQVFVFSKDSVVSRMFLMNTLRVSPSAYYDLINSAAATGKANLPVIIESDSRMSIVVAVNKGGLGVVRTAAYAANMPNLKIIEVKE